MEATKRHYKVQEARNQAKALIERRVEELKAEIAQKMPRAENGEQWAHICALETELIGLGGTY